MTALLLALLFGALAGTLGFTLGGRRSALVVEAATARASAAERQLAAAEAAHAAQVTAAERQGAWLEERFQTVTAQALQASSEQLVRLAESTLKQATTASTGSFAEFVAPLRAKLAEVETHLREVETSRTTAYAGLRQQIGEMQRTSESLRGETAQLVTALRAPQTRGRWGEMQLRRVLESAGATEHCDFVEQESLRDGDQAVLRPDVVVKLVGGKSVVVDSKVPFAAYLEAMEAPDDTRREDRRKAHARHFRDHVKKLSDKTYWSLVDASPEFVVMFVPADAFLDAALQVDPGLLDIAFEANVVIATPSTLIALLRTVAYTWRQDALASNARDVAALGRELYERLMTVGKKVDGLGRSLGTAVNSYNETVASLESRVLVTARKFKDLNVVEAELETPKQIEITPRSVQAPELVAAVEASPRVAVVQAPSLRGGGELALDLGLSESGLDGSGLDGSGLHEVAEHLAEVRKAAAGKPRSRRATG